MQKSEALFICPNKKSHTPPSAPGLNENFAPKDGQENLTPQKQRLIHPVKLQFQNLNFDPGGGDLPPHSRACQETASFMLTRSKDTSPHDNHRQ